MLTRAEQCQQHSPPWLCFCMNREPSPKRRAGVSLVFLRSHPDLVQAIEEAARARSVSASPASIMMIWPPPPKKMTRMNGRNGKAASPMSCETQRHASLTCSQEKGIFLLQHLLQFKRRYLLLFREQQYGRAHLAHLYRSDAHLSFEFPCEHLAALAACRCSQCSAGHVDVASDC